MSNAPRRAGRHFLQIPGPTPVPDRILRAMDMPVIDHRGPEFKRLGLRVLSGIRSVCRDYPPPITHPEYYYGFAGVTAAWQILYLLISTDPIRYRPVMIPPMLAKGSFVIAVVILFLQGRVASTIVGASMIDLLLVILFFVSYLRTPRQ
jgi:hypothetical protein